MKRYIFLFVCLVAAMTVNAQKQFRIWQNGESTRLTIADNPTIVYSADSGEPALVIGDATFPISTIDSICVVHQVLIQYSDTSAVISIPAAVAADITVERNKGHVTVTNTNVANEIEFVLSGSSTDGSFTYVGSYKTTVILNGVSLTSQQGAAIDIQCGKRIGLMLMPGTTNSFEDSALGEQKACFYCKGHMEVEGSGTLNVTGNLTHAIKVKEYLQFKKSTGIINIVKSAGDAIHVGQYYQQNGGTINITSTTLNDGIQVEFLTLDDDVTLDPDKEFNGQAIIKGGTIKAEITHQDQKGIKADSDITISGGTFDITASGNGSRGIQTDGNMVIGAEDNSTSITVVAAGAQCTDPEHEDDPHRCMGIKVDGNLTVNAGTTIVRNTGKKSRGIKVGGIYKKNGGTVTANITN